MPLPPPLPGETRYYWIRAVDSSGNKSAWVGPQGATTVIPLRVTASPSALTGQTDASLGAVNCQTWDSASAEIVGGVAPFAILWEKDPADVGGNTNCSEEGANTPTDLSTYWVSTYAGGSYSGGGTSGNWRCKVTDSAGTVEYSNRVNVSITFSAVDPL